MRSSSIRIISEIVSPLSAQESVILRADLSPSYAHAQFCFSSTKTQRVCMELKLPRDDLGDTHSMSAVTLPDGTILPSYLEGRLIELFRELYRTHNFIGDNLPKR